MDSDHSSASVLDNVDANLDCVLDDASISATPPTSTPMDVTPSATYAATAAAVGRIRRCPCGRRMSSLTHDYHSCCIFCRSIDCTLDQRCDECLLVSDVQYTVYVKPQKPLKRKLSLNRSVRVKVRLLTPICHPSLRL